MKAITLWQPWASAMALGAKKIETRSKAIRFRGDLAICSARKRLQPKDLSLEVHQWMLQVSEGSKDLHKILAGLPYGKVLCVVRLYDCRNAFDVWQGHGLPSGRLAEDEEILGCYHESGHPCGRYAWLTDNLRWLKEPVPVIGRQFLFDLPSSVEAQVLAQI